LGRIAIHPGRPRRWLLLAFPFSAGIFPDPPAPPTKVGYDGTPGAWHLLRMRSVSLRLRLIGLVAIGLLVSLAVAGGMACVNASRSVQNEMRAALAVARQAVENATVPQPGGASADLRHEIESVIAAFSGNRHVRLHLGGTAPASAMPIPESPAIGSVPGWFVHLVAGAPMTARVPVPLGGGEEGVVLIETDAHNEVLEVWNAFCDTVLVLTLFCGLNFLVIFVFVGRALRPLARLDAAFSEIGRDGYAAMPLAGRLAPELARLYQSFNRMARRLGDADARNRQLTEQLVTLQEEERREIARDLHDEIGSFLFAVNVDAATAARLAETGRMDQLPATLRGIAEAVGHMQKQVRSMLGRLRPTGLDEFGLGAALRHLVEFWRQRDPAIAYRLDLGDACEGLGSVVETTIYRVVQEGVSNAVRHGRPSLIEIAVRGAAPERVVVEIADDGVGAAGEAGGGFGLLGMAERVEGLGGTFATEARPGGGFLVRAVLPAAPAQRAEPHGADPVVEAVAA
jgi:two-component system sensor histidine kinase UhpB